MRSMNTRAAAVELAKTSKFWTNGTYIQFLRDDVTKAEMPKAYRPLDEL